MAIQNTLIVRRFIEGSSVADLSDRYTLAAWEVEEALRMALIKEEQKTIDFAVPATVHEPDPAQTTIAEVYGEITV